MWHKNTSTTFFRFVTNTTFVRQTEFSSLDCVCIPCSAVKRGESAGLYSTTASLDPVSVSVSGWELPFQKVHLW